MKRQKRRNKQEPWQAEALLHAMSSTEGSNRQKTDAHYVCAGEARDFQGSMLPLSRNSKWGSHPPGQVKPWCQLPLLMSAWKVLITPPPKWLNLLIFPDPTQTCTRKPSLYPRMGGDCIPWWFASHLLAHGPFLGHESSQHLPHWPLTWHTASI